MIEKTFEKKWADNRQRLLQEDEEYQRILRSYRKHNWADALVAPAALIGSMEFVAWLGVIESSFALSAIPETAALPCAKPEIIPPIPTPVQLVPPNMSLYYSVHFSGKTGRGKLNFFKIFF